MLTGLPEAEPTRTLIDELLAEQQQLTAVERFARQHDEAKLPAQARYYHGLIPLDKPRPGEQYAFAVDLDLCTGCKACVSACHSLNGLDDDETWRSVGLLQGGTAVEPYQQTVTTACHHCLDPACLNGCPVLAYEKDADTGIVRHLDDQCIGCQYCVLKCPYDVPKYSAKRGIVRKCDMCHGRLAAHEAPACVQACPSGAISIQLVSRTEIGHRCSVPNAQLLPGAFESSYAKPSTVYASRKPLPKNSRPVDAAVRRLEPAHWPLVWMLVLTQTAAGMLLASWLTALLAPQSFAIGKGALAICAFVLLQLGLAASVFHLGRPLGAWRAFLGFRHSWMSREIVAFGLFAIASGVFVLSALSTTIATADPVLSGIVALLGCVSVFCSAMIYVDTPRTSWIWSLTFPRFFGTTVLLGAAGAACTLGWADPLSNTVLAAAWAATAIRTALFVWEAQLLLRPFDPRSNPRYSAALLAWQCLKPVIVARIALFVVSTCFGLLGIVMSGSLAVCFATIAFVSTFSSQIIERYCFFVNAAAPRMPGGAG